MDMTSIDGEMGACRGSNLPARSCLFGASIQKLQLRSICLSRCVAWKHAEAQSQAGVRLFDTDVFFVLGMLVDQLLLVVIALEFDILPLSSTLAGLLT